jgi:hypothetical protein
MSAANFTKLAGIESGATADQTNAEIRAAVEAASDSNVFTDADHTKLNNIEANATADQTNAEIRAAVEAASDSNVFTDADHTKLNNIEANATADQTVTEIKSLIAGSPLDSSHLASNSVTTTQIADAELTTLAGMQSGTASKLADSTALTSDIADLNQLDGMAKQTTITNSDSHFPTSGAVVDFVANQIAPVGGLEVIADEDSFPATQPVSGVVISISNADGLVINSSGVATNARTLGNGSDNVTINNFPASLRSKTLSNNLGLLVSSTGASQTYNYHKLLAKEEDVLQLSDDINDFNARYRVGSSNPTSDNDAGDLFFNTSTQKLLVYNGTSNAWEEAQSVGNFFISTLSPAFNGSLQNFTITNAPTNAQQVILSIGGVIQKPNSGTSTPSEGFALDGSTIKLSAAPPSGTDYFVIVLGSTVNIGTPSNNTVTSAILQSGSVIEAKLGSGAVTRTKLNLVSTSSAPGLEVKGDGSSDGYLQLNCSQNSHGIKLKSPPHSASASYTLTFPSNIVNGQFLTTDANGNLSWAAVVTDLVNDSSPQLGAELQSNGHDIHLADGDKLRIGGTAGGATDGFEIFHDGSASYIQESGTGNLRVLASNLRFANSQNQLYAFFTHNAGCEFYHTGNKKLETRNDGVLIGDSQGYYCGDGADMRMFFNGTDGFIRAEAGKLNLDKAGGEKFIVCNPDGAVQIYHDNDESMATFASGIYVYGTGTTGYVAIYNQPGVDGSLAGYLRGYHNGSNASEIGLADQNNNWALRIDISGNSYFWRHFNPGTNNTYDLGSSSYRWRNIYTNDLNLSNEGGSNDVDGTWGSYTIQEGAEDLFLINKRNGKKYKFNLTEVN